MEPIFFLLEKGWTCEDQGIFSTRKSVDRKKQGSVLYYYFKFGKKQ